MLSDAINCTTTAIPNAINSGQFWYDNNGYKVQAHGGDIVKVADTYYMLGEDKSHDSSSFKNVAMYTSKDLTNWTFDKYILTPTSLGTDGNPAAELASCKIERPKIIYNEKTKKYVMWMHYETATDYGLARVAVATSDTIDGKYIYQGSFRPNNNDSRDMTVFKDDDGSAYLFSSSSVNKIMRLYKLTDDYLGIASELNIIYDGTTTSYREAPAVVKSNGVYYLITSAATGWYPNQAMYSTATSINGPWSTPTNIGNSSAFDSQSAFIATIQGTQKTSYIMCSDRWVSSKLGDSTYVWMPLTLNGASASMEYYDSYKIDATTGVITIPQTNPLISQGKPATASNVVSGSSASNANDGNYNTRWLTTGSSGNWPAWWTIDLGKQYNLSNLQISWYLAKGSEAYYKYRIWVSDDNVNYTLALDKMDNKTYGFTSDMLSDAKGRYVKIDMQSAVPFNNPTNNWYTPQLWEVKVFGAPVTP
jgi:hypothetical protein